MEFTFLGTSAGTPTKARNVTGLALMHGKPRHWYLIDCGEGTQHRLLHTRHSVMKLQAIFITHCHGDHTFGLPGLLTSASMLGRSEPLFLVAPRPVRDFVETALANSDSSLSYELKYIDSEAPEFQWEDEAIAVSATALSHRVSCRAFAFTEKNRERQLLTDRLEADGIEPGPIWGELQRGRDALLEDGRVVRSDTYTTVTRPARKIVVGGDNDTPDLLKTLCTDAQVLIHEATYTQAIADKVGPWPQHSSAASVARFAENAGLAHLVLTHFSSRYQLSRGAYPNIDEIELEARERYRGQLILARDLATYRLNRDLTLEAVASPPTQDPRTPRAE
ncbi:ribonuclease Z [Marinobacter koreensis]|uniref:Ribonuclease Z n=1 Tax=Marinobacter koreensis TaxID=335974 RepID=A0ABW0RN39_9GAMM|nr:ribonuclease Z [Marinobacter koreensis]MCK7549415.1 ribonuclease Z [Marinobacter koreensis]